jgi:hypothetical protein
MSSVRSVIHVAGLDRRVRLPGGRQAQAVLAHGRDALHPDAKRSPGFGTIEIRPEVFAEI